MMDVHEPIHDTGERRTYPNWMSREGARGQEYNAWGGEGGNPPEHETNLYFTRMLAGPMDFTPGIFDLLIEREPGVHGVPRSRTRERRSRSSSRSTSCYTHRCRWRLICRRIREPTRVSVHPDVAVDWDTTKTIDGRIGDYVIVAPQGAKQPEWFLGAITTRRPGHSMFRFRS